MRWKEKPEMLFDHFAEELRERDYERYVTTLFSPAKIRPALWVLYAFHNEIAKIEFIVKEPIMGLIRLQWWHDEITAIFQGKAPRHPLLEAIKILVGQNIGWQEMDFHQLIDGYEISFQKQENLEQSLVAKSLPVLKMACHAAKIHRDENVLAVIGHAYELAKLIKNNKTKDLEAILNFALANLQLLQKFLIKGPLLIAYCAQQDLVALKKHQACKKKFMLPLYLVMKQFN